MATTPNRSLGSYLNSKRRELEDRLLRIERDRRRLNQPQSADAEDRAIEWENDEVLDRLAEGTAGEIAQLHHAIERLEAGHYGYCEKCGTKIAPNRLRALPEATACTACVPTVRILRQRFAAHA